MAQATFAHPGDSRLVAGWHYPARIADMRSWFSSDQACLAHLDWLRWPDGFVCPHCGSSSAGGGQGMYRCRGCHRRVSVTAGTVFDKTRVPMTVWFEAVWQFTSSQAGVSAAHLHRVLPINSYQTAWTMPSKLRSVLSTADSERLTGRIQVDETLIGGVKPGKRGRGAAGKVLVAGAIEITETGWGRARMAVIPDATVPSLSAFAAANIAAGSTVVSDGLASYPAALSQYQHEPLNTSRSISTSSSSGSNAATLSNEAWSSCGSCNEPSLRHRSPTETWHASHARRRSIPPG